MPNPPTSIKRREFLTKAAFTGGAAGVAAVAFSKSPAEAAVVSDSQKSGYRETEHVKTYYELARF